MSARRASLVLLSGGLDSATALAMARAEGWELPLAITFDYGQHAARRERESAERLCDYFHIPHRAIELPFLHDLASGLTRLPESLPSPTQSDLDDPATTARTANAVWVPNRNGVFLSIAAAIAEAAGVSAICVGFNKEEAATFPDNSEPFLEATNHALSFSTANGVRVISPTASLTKIQIVHEAKRLGLPFSALWSCYRGEEIMCGRCESCMRLKRALKGNEISYEQLFKHASLY